MPKVLVRAAIAVGGRAVQITLQVHTPESNGAIDESGTFMNVCGSCRPGALRRKREDSREDRDRGDETEWARTRLFIAPTHDAPLLGYMWPHVATCGHMWLHVATHAVVYRSDSWMVHGSSHTCMYVNCSSTDLVFSFQMALGFMNEALPWFTTAVSGPHVAPESRDLCMAVARPTVEHVHTTIIKSSSTNRSP